MSAMQGDAGSACECQYTHTFLKLDLERDVQLAEMAGVMQEG